MQRALHTRGHIVAVWYGAMVEARGWGGELH